MKPVAQLHQGAVHESKRESSKSISTQISWSDVFEISQNVEKTRQVGTAKLRGVAI